MVCCSELFVKPLAAEHSRKTRSFHGHRMKAIPVGPQWHEAGAEEAAANPGAPRLRPLGQT